MGTASGKETALSVLSGALIAPGASPAREFRGTFNATVWGAFEGLYSLERSFDSGVTWVSLKDTAFGVAQTFTVSEPEPGVLYRLVCPQLSSGVINYRLSQ